RRTVRRSRTRAGARELRNGRAAVHEAGLSWRYDPRPPHLQAEDLEGDARGRDSAGRSGVGRRGEEPERGARGGLHDSHAGEADGGLDTASDERRVRGDLAKSEGRRVRGDLANGDAG